MKRILSIDGGGIKGVFPAAFLTHVESTLGRSVSDYFDLIVGTSTGGIIALGLGLGFSAQELLNLYINNADKIFPQRSLFEKFRQLIHAGYDPIPLKTVLQTTFGSRKLGDSKKRLVIPSFNLETGEVYNWKTSHHPRLEHDYKKSIVDVAMSTAAAPVYFPTYRSIGCVPLIDGGIWANNPTAVAAIEAVGVLEWPRDDLRILSLGCTSCPNDTSRARFQSLGAAYWVTRLTDLFLTAQSSSAMGMAQHLVSDRKFVKRVSPMIATNIRLDDSSEIPSLVGLADAESRKELPLLRSLFFQEPFADAFVPNHCL
jgi:patatin-like phospholipase/acyl hydrolase